MTNEILNNIQKTAFQFLIDYTNFNESTKGYGLTSDHSMRKNIASIASTGFMLSGLVIGVEQGYISREEALYKTKKTLVTLRDVVPHQFGFFAHFLDIETGERHQKCEYSTIDTALCLCGVITADSYFKDAEISEMAKTIMDRVDWSVLVHEKNEKKLLYMSYNPDKGGDYVGKKPGFIHQWEMFAEQLMMYVIIGGSGYSSMALSLYEGFERVHGSYKGIDYIYSPGNAQFVYQFPLAWLDLKHIVDKDGISWFANARQATLVHQACAIDYHTEFKTFSKYFFGFTASDTPKGYRVFGALPNIDNKINTDGTVSPFGPVGSLPFTPEISMDSIIEMMKVPGLWGPYGFYDGFNFEGDTPWISSRYISINKGLEMLMVNSYLYQDVQKAFMSHDIIKKGIEVLEWRTTD